MEKTGQMTEGTRVLIVKLSSLGDHFHALPVVHNLKEELNAEIDWVTQPEYAELVRCFSDVSRVLSFPRRRFLAGGLGFIRELRSSRYDYVVDLQGLLKSALVATWARGIRRIGPSYGREGARFFYSDVAGQRDKDRHAVDEALDVINFLHLEMLEPKFPVAFPKAQLDQSSPRVALIPCSRWKIKNWPLEHFVSVGKALRDKLNASLYLVGSPADTASCAQIEQALDGQVTNMCGQTSLVELGGVFQEMDLVVSVDSGPMHMAVAAGAPVLAVFGPTDPVRTGPFGEKHRVITAEHTPCWPCRNRDCPACLAAMEELSPARVVNAAVEMLNS